MHILRFVRLQVYSVKNVKLDVRVPSRTKSRFWSTSIDHLDSKFVPWILETLIGGQRLKMNYVYTLPCRGKYAHLYCNSKDLEITQGVVLSNCFDIGDVSIIASNSWCYSNYAFCLRIGPWKYSESLPWSGYLLADVLYSDNSSKLR